MKITTTLAAIALAVMPGLALAEGGCHGQKAKLTTASSCAVGYSWDETKGACILTPSS